MRGEVTCLHLGVGPAGDLADHVVYSILNLEGNVVPWGNQLAFGILCRCATGTFVNLAHQPVQCKNKLT